MGGTWKERGEKNNSLCDLEWIFSQGHTYELDKPLPQSIVTLSGPGSEQRRSLP